MTTAASAPAITAAQAKALEALADVVLPPPVPWWPQTWAWAVVGVLLLALLLWFAWQAVQRWRANRYRREALAELQQLDVRLDDASTRAAALTSLAELLKRTALAAWPRSQVAGLSGAGWVGFLESNAGAARDAARALAPLLDDAQYRGAAALASVDASTARGYTQAARTWIEKHRVSA